MTREDIERVLRTERVSWRGTLLLGAIFCGYVIAAIWRKG